MPFNDIQTNQIAPLAITLPLLSADVQAQLTRTVDGRQIVSGESDAILSAWTVVRRTAAGHWIACPNTAANFNCVVGVVMTAVIVGATANVLQAGDVTDSAFDGWAAGQSVFVGADARLSVIVPESGFLQCVGRVVTPGTLRVELWPPVDRGES